MSKKQRLLLVFIIIVLLSICAIIAQILIIKNNNRSTYVSKPDEELSEVSSINQFYNVKGCIGKYYTYCNMLFSMNNKSETNDEESQKNLSDTKRIIYNMLDKEYISYKNITEDNITSKIELTKDSVIYIDYMYVSERSENIYIYVVSGSLREKATNNITKFKVIVKTDYDNKTFSIMPQDYVEEKYSNISLGGTIDIGLDRIESNENNTYIFKNIEGQVYARDLFEDFKDRLLYDINSVYDRLDEEYKVKKFANVSEFEEYIKNKYENIESLQLSSYSKETESNHDRYIMVDSEEHYFIIDSTAIMKYTIVLDAYTLDLPEFINKYEYTTEQGKVLLNLNKIMLALNNADYKYVYDKLSDSFKTKNFKTLEDFKKYVQNNMFSYNYFEYAEFENEEDIYYKYNVKITDASVTNTKEIHKTFIMKLRKRKRF